MRARRRAWVSLAVVGAFVLVGCGDDDDDDTASTDAASDETTGDTATETTVADDAAATGADSEYCQGVIELNEALNGDGSGVTVELLDEIEAAAPEEIATEVALVTQAFREAVEAGSVFDAFEDPVVLENLEPISAYEAEVCGIDGGDEGSDQDPSVTEVDPAAAQVAVEATEYAFAFETPVAGPTSFTMTNAGAEGHVMVLLRLEEGAVLDDVLAAEGEVGVAEEFDSDFAAPGGEAVVTADLVAGDWVLLCPIPAADEEPHFAKGMLTEFTIE